MNYQLVINKKVRKKDLPKVPQKDRKKIVRVIGSLARNPRPASAKKLTNRDEYRVRQGNYRILYVVEDKIKVVKVHKVAARGKVYQNK